jgi:hypothetical protein
LKLKKLFKPVKQSPTSIYGTYYLPVQFYSGSITSDGYYTETKPANSFQLIDSRLLACGNMIAASSANKNFKNELMQFDLNGKQSKGIWT